MVDVHLPTDVQRRVSIERFNRAHEGILPLGYYDRPDNGGLSLQAADYGTFVALLNQDKLRGRDNKTLLEDTCLQADAAGFPGAARTRRFRASRP
jgi:hypothetical protein